MYEPVDKLVSHIPTMQRKLTKTAAQEEYAEQLMKAPDNHTAAALYMAARTVYSLDILTWEPETMWQTFEGDGYIWEEEARNKLQAAITLVLNPSFYWDSIVFQQTVQALNDQPFDPEALQEPAISHMCWAVYEAGIIRGLDPDDPEMIPEFDEDVQMFTAVVLKRAGCIYPPKPLRYSTDALTSLYPVDTAPMKKDVAKAWKAVNQNRLESTTFSETPVDVQLTKLAICYLYVRERSEDLAEELLGFRLT
ncbi:MAG: hypothetical protein DRP01_00385 [Archaeoglobales archaeon]|nr:MAG: hypothetical protein DRP01_00385 [Archaeoglobales archaeon]